MHRRVRVRGFPSSPTINSPLGSEARAAGRRLMSHHIPAIATIGALIAIREGLSRETTPLAASRSRATEIFDESSLLLTRRVRFEYLQLGRVHADARTQPDGQKVGSHAGESRIVKTVRRTLPPLLTKCIRSVRLRE